MIYVAVKITSPNLGLLNDRYVVFNKIRIQIVNFEMLVTPIKNLGFPCLEMVNMNTKLTESNSVLKRTNHLSVDSD